MHVSRRLVAVILAVLFGTGVLAYATRSPEPSPAVTGPLVQLVSRHGAVIRWSTAAPVRGQVRYGVHPESLTESAVEPDAVLAHEVRLAGLQGSTTYFYAIDSGTELVASGDQYFTTAPAPDEPFRFAVFGDSQGGPDTCVAPPGWRAVAQLVDQARPALVLGAGDYVADGAAAGCWESWIEASGGLFRHTPFYPALGNHDYERQYYTGEENAGLRNLTRWFALPLGPDPATATTYYGFTFGNSRFIVLDAYKDRRPGSPQLLWLEHELALARSETGVEHIFVVSHPTFEGVGYFCPPESRDRHQARNREWVQPLLERYGVTATFSGHEHSYSRVEKNGIQYVVTGGGGGRLEGYRRPRCPDTPGLAAYHGRSHHAVIVDVDGASVRYRAVGVDGTLLDSWAQEGGPRVIPAAAPESVTAPAETLAR